MNEPVFNLLRPVTEDKEDEPGPGPEAATCISTEDTEAGPRGAGITRINKWDLFLLGDNIYITDIVHLKTRIFDINCFHLLCFDLI